MQYAERLPTLPSPRTMVAPLVALVIGAGAATGAYALLDNDGSSSASGTTKVIVTEPVQPGSGTAAKDEAAVAAAVGQVGGGAELHGSKASQYGTSQYRLAEPQYGSADHGTSGYRFSQPQSGSADHGTFSQPQSGPRP
jgi:hypothetical protein